MIAHFPAYCIVFTADDRRRQQAESLRKIFPHLKTIPAVTHHDLTRHHLQDLQQQKILDRMSIAFNVTGEIGCYLSHRIALQDFLDSSANYCFIFEDDIALPDNFCGQVDKLLTGNTFDWDFIYLYDYANVGQNEELLSMRPAEHILNTMAYVISRRGALKFLSHATPMCGQAIDQHYCEMTRQGELKAFIVTRNMVKNLGYVDRHTTGTIASMIRQSPVLPIYFYWQILYRIFYYPYFIFCVVPYKLLWSKNAYMIMYGVRKIEKIQYGWTQIKEWCLSVFKH